jgi:hypothetical protein
MKKIFLVFGIAAFSAAAAQEKELFDIKDHLQKKASKQTDRFPLALDPGFGSPKPHTTYSPSMRSYLLPDNSRITGIGNMPCIKPDMRQFKTMPNPGLGNFTTHKNSLQHSRPGNIPNAAIPKDYYLSH